MLISLERGTIIIHWHDIHNYIYLIILYSGSLVSLPDNGSLDIKAFVMGVVADLPARAMILNVSQING